MPFDIVLTDPFVVDSKSEVFKLWLQCMPKEQAVEKLLESYLATSEWPNIAQQHQTKLRALFDNDTTDQYRMFGMLERYLKEPLRLRTQHVCYLDSETQRVLIHNYYGLDETTILDLIKLCRDRPGQSKRRNLNKHGKTSQFSASNSSPLYRQLSNVMRVYTHLRSSKGEHELLQSIQSVFCLSKELASDYAHLIFFLHHGITLMRRDGLREKAIARWWSLKKIADAIMTAWCAVPKTQTMRHIEKYGLYIELQEQFCEQVASVAIRVRKMLARAAKLTTAVKRRERRRSQLRAKLKALQAARQQHVDRAVEVVLKIGAHLSKPKNFISGLLLDLHKLNESLAQAQVPGGAARFFGILASAIDESQSKPEGAGAEDQRRAYSSSASSEISISEAPFDSIAASHVQQKHKDKAETSNKSVPNDTNTYTTSNTTLNKPISNVEHKFIAGRYEWQQFIHTLEVVIRALRTPVHDTEP